MNLIAYIYYQFLIWLDGQHPDVVRENEGSRE